MDAMRHGIRVGADPGRDAARVRAGERARSKPARGFSPAHGNPDMCAAPSRALPADERAAQEIDGMHRPVARRADPKHPSTTFDTDRAVPR